MCVLNLNTCLMRSARSGTCSALIVDLFCLFLDPSDSLAHPGVGSSRQAGTINPEERVFHGCETSTASLPEPLCNHCYLISAAPLS